MPRLLFLVALALGALNTAALAEDPPDQAKADSFDGRMFAGPPGQKAYACFTRSYDGDHLARHPKQKVAAMKLLMTAENSAEDNSTSYSFRLGVKYRHRPGDFDSSGFCNHAVAQDGPHEIRFDCAVDCEGGGINVALSQDDRAAIVRLEKIAVWNNNKPDDEAGEALFAGADDRIFRLDQTATADCAVLVTDRKELAAIRHK